MFSSTIVDLAIGLTFLYFVLSIIASAASELLESLLKNRAMDLELGIRELLNDPSDDAIDLDVVELEQMRHGVERSGRRRNGQRKNQFTTRRQMPTRPSGSKMRKAAIRLYWPGECSP